MRLVGAVDTVIALAVRGWPPKNLTIGSFKGSVRLMIRNAIRL